MLLLGPLAECNQVVLQAIDRVAERPLLVVVLRAVAGRIVAGRVRRAPVGHVLDQGRARAAPGPLGCPLRHRVHGEEIVSVHADPRHPVAGAARRKRALFAARESLEGRDRPLVVDDVEDHRRLVHRGKQHRVVKIGFGARAFAQPAHGNVVLALDRCGHRPADGLRELGREVARDREDPPRRPVIHHGQLPALAHVARVRQQLAHQVDERPPADHVEPLVAVRRKQHVPGAQRHRLSDRHGFLAERAHVEGDLSLALGALHAIVEHSRKQHVLEADLQIRRVEMRVPGTDGAVLVVEHANELGGEVADVADAGVDVRPWYRPGRRRFEVAEVRFLARPGVWLGCMQTRSAGHGSSASSGERERAR